MAKKKSGLPSLEGMFSDSPAPAEPEPTPSTPAPPAAEEKRDENEEVVTSIRILKRTQVNLHRLKNYELAQGNRVTFGQLIDEALADLMTKKGIEANL